MTPTPKPDLTEHEEEATPFDDVMRKLLDAKPAAKAPEDSSKGGEAVPAASDPKH